MRLQYNKPATLPRSTDLRKDQTVLSCSFANLTSMRVNRETKHAQPNLWRRIPNTPIVRHKVAGGQPAAFRIRRSAAVEDRGKAELELFAAQRHRRRVEPLAARIRNRSTRVERVCMPATRRLFEQIQRSRSVPWQPPLLGASQQPTPGESRCLHSSRTWLHKPRLLWLPKTVPKDAERSVSNPA